MPGVQISALLTAHSDPVNPTLQASSTTHRLAHGVSSRVTHPLPRRTLDCTQGEKTPGLKPQVLAAAAAGQVMGRTGPGDVGLGRGSPHVGELLKGFRETLHVRKPSLTKMLPTFLEAGSCHTALPVRSSPIG